MSENSSLEYSSDDDGEDKALIVNGSDDFNCENEEITYTMVLSSEIKKLMEDLIKETSQMMNLNYTTVRLLLNFYKWDKQSLIEEYFESNVEGLLEKAKLPNHDYMKRQENIEDFSCLSTPSVLSSKIIEDKNYDPFKNSNSHTEVYECTICCDEYPKHEMRGLACDHFFCLNCWQTYLKVEITTKLVCMAIRCPEEKCDLILDDNVVRDILRNDAKLIRAYNRSIACSFIENNKCMRWCSNSNCDFVAFLSNNNSNSSAPTKIICHHCEECFCFNCGNIWHEPCGCREFKIWLDYISTDAISLKWIGSHTKDCPKCLEGIEKNGGCNHMTCSKCLHQFCWICLKPWSSHSNDAYNCNKPDDKEFDRETNQKHLKYFSFFYERYFNHEKSMNLEKKLRSEIRTRLSLIKNQSEIFISETLIESAIETLCKARKYLQFSYAFAFFLVTSNVSAIFQTNQAQLESTTENFSKLLEDNSIPSDILDYKKNIEHNIALCEQRLKVIHEFVQDCYAKCLWEYIKLR